MTQLGRSARRLFTSSIILTSLLVPPAFGTESCAYLTPDAFEGGGGDGGVAAVKNTIGTGAKAKTVWDFGGSTLYIHTDKFWITRTGNTTVTPRIQWFANSTDTTKNVCWEVCVVHSKFSTVTDPADNGGLVIECSVAKQPAAIVATANEPLEKVLNSVSVRDTSGTAAASASSIRGARTTTTVARVACDANDYAGDARFWGMALCWTATTP